MRLIQKERIRWKGRHSLYLKQKREKYCCLQTHHLLLFLALFLHGNSGFSLCLHWHSFVLHSPFSFSLTPKRPSLYFRCYHKSAAKPWARLLALGTLAALTVTSALQPQKPTQTSVLSSPQSISWSIEDFN